MERADLAGPRSRVAILLTFLLSLALPAVLRSQGLPAAPAPGAPQAVIVKAAHLIDGRSDRPRDGVAVLVMGERIRAVGTAAEIAGQAPAGTRTIDLGGKMTLNCNM